METGGPDGRCWDCKLGRLCPGKQGCGQQTLETAGEEAAWSRKGQAPAQVSCSTFPLRNKTKIAQSHHSSDILTQSTALPATFPFCVRANSLPMLPCFLRWLKSMYRVQLSLRTAPVSQGCCLMVLFYCLFQKVPVENNRVKKQSVKMLPAVLN